MLAQSAGAVEYTCCIAIIITLIYELQWKNERTHFFIKIYISHTLFFKGLMLLWYVRDKWRQGQTAILTQLLLLTIARWVIFKNPLSTSASWLGLLNRGSPRATALSLQAGPHSGLPVSTNSTAASTCLYSFIRPLASASSSAYLHRSISDWRLGQGSIYNTLGKTTGQYITHWVRPPPMCPGYDTKQSDGEVPVMLGLWGIRSTPSLPLLPGPL